MKILARVACVPVFAFSALAQVKPAALKADAAAKSETVVLSPFEVTTDTKGYYAPNTMSGTRFNTRIEDLASSITVITKEQMQDFAMLDVNDIFLYTASTEGTGTFTDLSVDRNGSVSDNVQLNPASANRVRGLSAANISLGNFETMGRVPVDPLAIDAIEISRGPNSSVFGLGNPAGTVNQVPASANVGRSRAQVQFRGDSYGGYRTSLDVNRVLVKDRLALRVSGALQHDGFVRKPSGVNTERYNTFVKYAPFASTTISAGVQYYHQYGVRPNFSPPRDNISYWVQNGRPTWDPLGQVIHVDGRTLGPFTAATYAGPDYFTNTFTLSTSAHLFVDHGGGVFWSAPSTFSNLNNGPISGAQTVRFMATSGGPGVVAGKPGDQPLFTTTPSIRDKSIYDWSKINLASVNRDHDRVLTSSFQINQRFLNTGRQSLDAQVAFLREDAKRVRRDYVGIANSQGQSGQLLIDINERLLDGTPNPFFLRPYIAQGQPPTEYVPAKWDSYRGQVAYKLDLTHEKNALRWLGRHQISGYDEYKYRVNRRMNYREGVADLGNHPWAAVPANSTSNSSPSITRELLRFYVGDASGSNVDYAPSDFAEGTYPFVWGSYPSTPNPPVSAASGTFRREVTQLGLVSSSTGSLGSNNSKTILKAHGWVMQSHFLGERIVTTFGVRQDRQYQKSGTTDVLAVNRDGITFNQDALNHWQAGDYKFNSGQTRQGGGVVRPFRDFAYLGQLKQAGAGGSLLSDVLRGLSLTYNKSDSFRPVDPKVNVYLQSLPNPSGRGKDYGCWLDLADGRFVLRVNRWETNQLNKSGGDAGTIAQRMIREDIPNTSNQPYILNTQATNWVRAVNPAFTEAQVSAEVARQTKIPTDRLDGLLDQFNNISSTQDVSAKGTEIELNYNPTRAWTVAASATDTRSINSNVSKELGQYLNERLAVWTTIVDQRTGNRWWTTNYGGTQTPAQNFAAFLDTPYNVVKQLEGKANPQIRRYAAKFSTNYRLSGFTEHPLWRNVNVGGAVRWDDRAAIGYYGVQKLPAVITALDANNPIYDRSNLGRGFRGNYYFDAFIGYRRRLWANRIGATFQLNGRNLQESGHLQPVAAFPDGTPSAYRIVDPRQFIASVTFDL